jgi:hypothetical protein
MEQGNFVTVRFKRHFAEQKLWVFIGQINQLTEHWIEIEGKAIVFNTGQTNPIDIDKEPRTLVCPRENIAHVRILPNNFDIREIQTYRKNARWYIRVEDAADASLGEQ